MRTNDLPTELLCFQMSNQPISTTSIMHPSANVQAQGTNRECLKLHYYNIFSSYKQECGEVGGGKETEIKPVLALLPHETHR